MSGHFPFTGKGVRYGMARLAVTAFFEKHAFNLAIQEQYYKWWFDWSKRFVENDSDLKVTKAGGFASYPYGQHSFHSFHLNDKMWATAMCDLGDLIRDTIMPKLDHSALEKLEHEHEHLVADLKKKTEQSPRKPAPDVGYFRHT